MYLFSKLTKYDVWSRMAVHVAMDNLVVIEDISKYILKFL